MSSRTRSTQEEEGDEAVMDVKWLESAKTYSIFI